MHFHTILIPIRTGITTFQKFSNYFKAVIRKLILNSYIIRVSECIDHNGYSVVAILLLIETVPGALESLRIVPALNDIRMRDIGK
jgi:hypothetical protein